MVVVEIVLERVTIATETKFHLNIINNYEKQYYIKIQRLWWLRLSTWFLLYITVPSQFIYLIYTSYNKNDPGLFSSCGRYKTKSIFTSLFSSKLSPVIMNISPGTINPKLSAVIALSSFSMSNPCMKTVMMSMVKQLLILMMTFEKIWLMRMVLIVRLNPSMMPM